MTGDSPIGYMLTHEFCCLQLSWSHRGLRQPWDQPCWPDLSYEGQQYFELFLIQRWRETLRLQGYLLRWRLRVCCHGHQGRSLHEDRPCWRGLTVKIVRYCSSKVTNREARPSKDENLRCGDQHLWSLRFLR